MSNTEHLVLAGRL